MYELNITPEFCS
jgi:hypothetical protein